MNNQDNKKKSDIQIISDAFQKSAAVLPKYEKVMVSISGGADSDIVLDMLKRIQTSCKKNNFSFPKLMYVFFNTGVEYNATINHLDYLEKKYNITIKRVRAPMPVPLGVKTYGQPFLNKRVSSLINRLQKKGFKFEDKPLNVLIEEYPNCKAALRWWCNDFGEGSKFNISYNKYLKEFMIANPPDFIISEKCCNGAKKHAAHLTENKYAIDLNITGIRKSEGGARSTSYKSCWSRMPNNVDTFRPIQWFLNSTKEVYVNKYNIENSDCYTLYGLKRTGCACCPFGRDFEFELNVVQKYEPKLYKFVNNIFANSFEYTRKYRKFVADMSKK